MNWHLIAGIYSEAEQANQVTKISAPEIYNNACEPGAY